MGGSGVELSNEGGGSLRAPRSVEPLVDQDDVPGALGLGEPERLVAGTRNAQFIAVVTQEVGVGLEDRLVIVDQEDARDHGALL